MRWFQSASRESQETLHARHRADVDVDVLQDEGLVLVHEPELVDPVLLGQKFKGLVRVLVDVLV